MAGKVNDTQRKQGFDGMKPAVNGSSTTSGTVLKGRKEPQPAPPPLTRNLDSVASLPIRGTGSERRVMKRWLWLAISVVAGIAAIVLWLTI